MPVYIIYTFNKTKDSWLCISVHTFSKAQDSWLCTSSYAFSKAFPCRELQIFVIGFERLFICFILTMLFWFSE